MPQCDAMHVDNSRVKAVIAQRCTMPHDAEMHCTMPCQIQCERTFTSINPDNWLHQNSLAAFSGWTGE